MSLSLFGIFQWTLPFLLNPNNMASPTYTLMTPGLTGTTWAYIWALGILALALGTLFTRYLALPSLVLLLAWTVFYAFITWVIYGATGGFNSGVGNYFILSVFALAGFIYSVKLQLIKYGVLHGRAT